MRSSGFWGHCLRTQYDGAWRSIAVGAVTSDRPANFGPPGQRTTACMKDCMRRPWIGLREGRATMQGKEVAGRELGLRSGGTVGLLRKLRRAAPPVPVS